MTKNFERKIDPENLPFTLPIIKTNKQVLYPGCEIPLTISIYEFQTIQEKIKPELDLIGILPFCDLQHSSYKSLNTNMIGCCAQLKDFKKINDNDYFYLLKGICRFTVLEKKFQESGFIINCEVSYNRFKSDFAPQKNIAYNTTRLYYNLLRHFEKNDINCDINYLKNLPNRELITFLIQNCNLSFTDKQALLQCCDSSQQINLFMSILEMENFMNSSNYSLTWNQGYFH